MKYIEVPDPVQVDGREWPLAVYIVWLVDNDKRFAARGSGLRMAVRIVRAVEASGPDAPWYPLESEDHAMLLDAAENPQRVQGAPDYPLTRARALVPYNDALRDALDQPPGDAVPPEARPS